MQPQASGIKVPLSFILCSIILLDSSAPISSFTWLLHNHLDRVKRRDGCISLKLCINSGLYKCGQQPTENIAQ